MCGYVWFLKKLKENKIKFKINIYYYFKKKYFFIYFFSSYFSSQKYSFNVLQLLQKLGKRKEKKKRKEKIDGLNAARLGWV